MTAQCQLNDMQASAATTASKTVAAALAALPLSIQKALAIPAAAERAEHKRAANLTVLNAWPTGLGEAVMVEAITF
jgi:hypothetical protein